MAVVWLNQNVSAWYTPSAWYYWDEATQSAQPYGRNPQPGDTAYLNGYDVTGNLSSLTFMGKVSNALNPYTNRSGGRFTTVYGNSHTFKEIEVGDAHFMGGITNSIVNITFTAETINLIGTGVLYNKGGSYVANISVIGNIFRNSFGNICLGTSGGGTFTLTGNIVAERGLSNQSYNIRIVGNASVKNSPLQTSGTLEINGNALADNAYFYAGTSAIINGSMTYKNYEPLKGLIRVGTLSVPDNFIVTNEGGVDISAIFTKYTMNNHQQYPSENEVKEGTEYVWGEKVGTYQVPPESVVLKDYAYDNGERTGTLENEVTVNVGCTNPQDVRKDIPLANMGTVGTMVIPAPENVLEGTIYDNGTEGTLESQSTADYPAEDKVLIGTSYDHYNMTGTLEPGGDNPQESDVRFGVPYNHNLNTGKAHIPSSEDVRKNVPVEDTVGQIVIPRTSEVKKDVEFDVDSVGTLESVIETNNTINVYRKSSSI